MRRFIRTSSVALVGLAMLAGPLVPLVAAGSRSSDAPPSAGRARADDSWIVSLQAGASPRSQAAPLAHAAGGQVGHIYTYAINGFQFRGSAAAAEALRSNPYVASVVADRPVYLTESLPNGIERISAYDNDTPASSAYHQGYRGNGARIAIMDTGIDLDHPDLVNAIDQGLGKNCVADALPPNDGYGHGTHVAGTAAAPLNGVGVVGVAPEARLVAVKVFDDAGNSSESLVLCGFEHVLSLNADADPTNDVDILSMSFGEQRPWGDCSSDPLHTAVCRAYGAGIIMVAGAGNAAVNASNFVPAAFDEVIGVSALADFDASRGGLAGCGVVPDLGWFECDDTFAFFSNYGLSVDVIAPGVSVYSTWAGGGYFTSSGTSMATPHVSGVVALMAALSPSLTPAQARTLLRQSGECPNGTVAGADGACAGQGTWPDDPDGTPEPMVNALRAAQAVGGAPPPPTPPSAATLTSATGGNGSVALVWSPPASDGGSPVTNYEIWRGPTSGSEVLLLTTVDAGTTYTDASVTNGQTYFYQVAAVNSVGSGPRSNELSATPLASPPVTRTGGTASNFASASSTTGSVAFTLPGGSNRLVAMVSVGSASALVTSVTWRPNAANPAEDQAFTFVGRQAAPAGGAVEVWTLANPTPTVSGSSVNHVMGANVKRVMGLHSLSSAGSVGVPVGASTNDSSIGVTVASQTGSLVLDVLYGNNSTTAYTAGAGQAEHWNTSAKKGNDYLRGAGSEETGAPMVTMSWTSAKVTNMAMLAVSFGL
jgi:subtilisin